MGDGRAVAGSPVCRVHRQPQTFVRVRDGGIISSVADPTTTDPDKYKVIFENDRVRVLEYRDEPGQATQPHQHPDSVMYTLSSFERRLIGENGESRDVALGAGEVRWLDAQVHSGENIGDSPTHVLFVELKQQERSAEVGTGSLGPS
jgi:quercetin dioxygenase-like cupin family protein